MYNVTLRCVCITTVAVENQQILNNVSVCILALFGIQSTSFLQCGMSGSTIFFYIISNSTIFRKKSTAHKMCVLIHSINFV